MTEDFSQLCDQVVDGLGGAANIEELEACITRMRVVVTDPSLVDDRELRAVGALGLVKQGQVVQVILGLQTDDVVAALEEKLGLYSAD